MGEEHSVELLAKWDALQRVIDFVEPKFTERLRKSISKSTDISKVKYIIQRKSLDSTVEKFKRKGRDIDSFSDLLRAVIVVSSKTSLQSVVNGLKYYFDFAKVDIKEGTKDKPYSNAIHIDVLCEGFVCEVQLMSRQIYRYKQEADKTYKADMSKEEKRKLQEKWFNRGKFMEDAVRKAYELTDKVYTILKKADADEETTKALIALLHEAATKQNMGDYSYIVGGAVRDFVMGVFPKDIDIVVESTKDENGNVKNAVTLGEEVASMVGVSKIQADNYGVVHIGPIPNDLFYNDVNLKGQKIEIVTARKEKYDKGSHKPAKVEPGTIHDDLERRDFTFNTLMWKLSDLSGEIADAPVIDLLGNGIEDLKNGIVKTPLEPAETFTDDPSRMLRAVRFAVKYDAQLDDETKKAITNLAGEIKRMPWEPIGDIFVIKILTKLPKEKAKKAFEMMDDLNLLKPTLEYVDKKFIERQMRSVYGNDFGMLMYINLWLEKYGIRPMWFKIPQEMYGKLKEHYGLLSPQKFQELCSKLKTNMVDTRILMDNGITGSKLGEALLEAKKMLINNPEISKDEIMANLIDI